MGQKKLNGKQSVLIFLDRRSKNAVEWLRENSVGGFSLGAFLRRKIIEHAEQEGYEKEITREDI